ncbi:MAG TPA: alkaline phosphatase family protein, partial [Polyangiaceae bacterium]
MSRRAALQHIGLGIGAAAFGASCVPGPDHCAGGPDPSPDANTAGRKLLAGIDTFVVVMMENRSFDHFLGGLSLDPNYPARDIVDGLHGQESNDDVNGVPVLVHPTPGVLNGGPVHDWDSARRTFDLGRNDGFVRVNEGPTQADTMTYHERSRLPLHYALADEYAVCDRWFASVMGPTWPNRFYLHAATSEGRRGNTPILDVGPATIWENMEKRCLTCKGYAAGLIPWYLTAFPGKALSGSDPMIHARIENFFDDARSGNLPNFSLIDPDFFSNDMHPPHDLALGEAFLGSIVRAMQQSPQWGRSLLVITYDEHGGFFDHVAPPTTSDVRAEFRQLGFRVPALVIGPTVRRGAVVSTTFEHVSIAATLGARFGMESLGPRMDAAHDLSSCIDPALVGAAPQRSRKLPVASFDLRGGVPFNLHWSSQPEMELAVLLGRVPAGALDPRSSEERFRSWLRRAQELEAATVRD